MKLPRGLRRLLARGLSYAAVPRLLLRTTTLRLTRRRAGVAVVYHRVDERPGDPATELVPALAASVFMRQIALLKLAFRLVPASALPTATRTRRRGQRLPLAITFDDDLECHIRITVPLLRRAGAPATFFLSGTALASHERHWWEHLQAAVDAGFADGVLRRDDVAAAVTGAWSGAAEDIHGVASAMKHLDRAERNALARRFAAVAGETADGAQPLSVEGIRDIAAAEFEIGFHTLGHDYLPSLDAAALANALQRGRSRLERVAGRPLETIAYPHGGADDRVAAAARAAGYRAGFTTAATVVRPDGDDLLLGRIECSYRSATELAERLCVALRD